MFDDSAPIFMQLANQLCVEIVVGIYPDGAKAPSISELAVSHCTNPVAMNCAIALLVERGVLIRRRGIGTFVVDGVRFHLIEERCQTLADWYAHPLITEAVTPGTNGRELIALVQKEVNP